MNQLKRQMKYISLDMFSRIGITWNNAKYYTGLSFVVHTYSFRREYFSVNNAYASLKFYAGFYFGKKKSRPPVLERTSGRQGRLNKHPHHIEQRFDAGILRKPPPSYHCLFRTRIFNFQFSTLNCQLSTVNCKLSIVNCL